MCVEVFITGHFKSAAENEIGVKCEWQKIKLREFTRP